MKSLGFFALAATAAMAVAASAGAQSLKARQFQAKEDEYLARSIEDTSKRCESQISAKIDWAAIKQDEPGSSSPSGYCGEALNAIGSLCGQAMAKEAVQKGVKTLVCTMGGPRAISLKDGTLTYTMEYDSANNEDYIKAFLKEHL